MGAGEPLEAGVFGDAQRHAVFGAKLLQLGNHAVRDARDALGKQAVHHGFVQVQLVLDREVDEVGVCRTGKETKK